VILVAGGTGRLGTLVVDRLSGLGFDVRVLSRDPQRAAHLEGRAEVFTGDVVDRVAVDRAVAGVDLVVSAIHGFVGPRGVSPRTVDRDGNANLTRAAKAAGADLVLMSVVGADPNSPMELFRMKYAAEQCAAAGGLPVTVVRSTAFMELWIDLLRATATRSGRPLVFGGGDNPINFVSVGDVAALIEHVVTNPITRGQVLEIGGPDNLSFNEVALAVQLADDRTGPPRHIPPPMLRLVAGTVGRFKHQVGRQTRAALAMDRVDLTFDATPIHRMFDNLPSTSLTEVLGASH
jgi:uncharacterized protein YbjT (DUF2867 family)